MNAFNILIASVLALFAAATCVWLWQVSVAESTVLDLAGRPVDPFAATGTAATVLLFVRTDCPTSNRYAPEIQRLFDEYASRNVAFWLVYVDSAETPTQIRNHMAEYGYQLPALRDIRHDLVDMSEATVTPETAVYAPDGEVVYRGRIDNRYTAFGKGRAEPTRRDLEQALEAVLAGRRVLDTTTQSVGCYIEDLK